MMNKPIPDPLIDEIEAYKAKCSYLEAERDALKAVNAELIVVLEDIQGMDDSSLWEQNDTVSYIAKFARQAINKAREVMDE